MSCGTAFYMLARVSAHLGALLLYVRHGVRESCRYIALIAAQCQHGMRPRHVSGHPS
jgi:hypothetical protein